MDDYLRSLGLADAPAVRAALEDLDVTTRAGWLSIAQDEEDLAEAIGALKQAHISLGDRNKMKRAHLHVPEPSVSAAPEPEPMALPAAMSKSKHELRQMLAIKLLTREECLAQLQALPMGETEALEWIEGVD